MKPIGNVSQAFKLQCEARFWLGYCGDNPAKIKAQLVRLEEKRGGPQSELRDEMLKQFGEKKGGK
jgi:hypothetical protein